MEVKSGPGQIIWCPLCESIMHKNDNHYVCSANDTHSCLIVKEYQKYQSGEKDIRWLRFRMKVRMGKKIHGR